MQVKYGFGLSQNDNIGSSERSWIYFKDPDRLVNRLDVYYIYGVKEGKISWIAPRFGA